MAKPMKKTTKNILIMLVVLVLLGGAAAAMYFIKPAAETQEEPSSAEESSSTAVTVSEWKLADIASVEIQNGAGSFTLIPDPAADLETLSASEFLVKGLEKYPVSPTAMSGLLSCLTPMTAAKDLGEKDALADYGLSGPEACKVTVTDREGAATQLVLGSQPGESAGRYVLKDGRVYIVSLVNSAFFGNEFALLDSTLFTVRDRVLTEEEKNSASAELENLMTVFKLSGAHYPDPIEIRYDSKAISIYRMEAPVLADSGTPAYDSVIEALKSLNSEGVAAVGLTDELLEEYGLLEPDVVLEFTMNGDSHRVTLSEVRPDGKRWLTLDDTDMIYRISNSSVSAWAEASLLSLRMSYVWLANIADVDRYTLTTEDGKSYSYEITQTVNEEKSTENNTAYDYTIKNAQGKDIDYTVYQPFYRDLLSLSVLNSDKTEFSGKPLLKVEYGYREGGSDVVEYYPYSDERCLAVVNGRFNGMLRRKEVEKILEKIPLLDSNRSE